MKKLLLLILFFFLYFIFIATLNGAEKLSCENCSYPLQQNYDSGAYDSLHTTHSNFLSPLSLRCESRINPLGIDVLNPRLSWILIPTDVNKRSLYQTAYQIIVASTKSKLLSGLGDLWNSGKKISSQNAFIVYAGKQLTSCMDCWWRVRVWDNNNQVSRWSQPARWSMGLLHDHDWSSSWIGYIYNGKAHPNLPPATYWRKKISIEKKVSRAMLYASALGDYVLYLNKKRVGKDYFSPGWPEFRKRVYYRTYDVTSMIKQGSNALGAILSTGWYAGYIWAGPFNYGTTPKILMQLNVVYEDGTRATFGTDSTWKVSYGPLIEADIQQGEIYDARKEIPNWNSIGLNDSNWAGPDVIEEALPVKIKKVNRNAWLYSAPHPPVTKQREIKPLNLSNPRPGVYIFDLGETIAGWARLKAQGPRGTKITMRYSGMLNRDGTIYTKYLREARATDTYIMKGSIQTEIWEPSFTYHGFRYVEVTGYPGKPKIDAITGVVCNSNVERTGQFSCSDKRVNQLYKNCVSTMASNLVDLVTGCSDRAERLGWMGAGQMFYSLCYSFDMDAFLTKWMTDMVDAQSLGASGSYLQCSPMWGDIESPGWSDDGVCLPYALYRFYGDTRIIKENYCSLTTYLNHIERSLTEYLRIGPVYHYAGQKFVGYGDWLSVVGDRVADSDILNTLFNGWSVSNMVEMAEAIGKKRDAQRYQQLLGNMKNAFGKAYVSSNGKIRDDNQTEYALGLYFGFFPKQKIKLAVDHLVKDILYKSHKQTGPTIANMSPIIPPSHLTTGFHGSRALLPVLSRYGRNDVAYKLLLQDTYPSWLYPVTIGATSTWERWDSWIKGKGFQDPRMNSFGMPHLMASIVEWLMGYVGGIQSIKAGFHKFAIRPYIGKGLTWARASYRSINGIILSKWEKHKGGLITLHVIVPPNTEALISLPKLGNGRMVVYDEEKLVWAKNKFVGEHNGITGASEDSMYVIFNVGSGSYNFRIE